MADALVDLTFYELKKKGIEPKGEYIRKIIPIREYNYNDYISWDDDVRRELIDGVVYQMASPSEWHQWVTMEISRQLGNFLEGKKCTTYIAPFDVRLFYEEDGSDNTVVQPDILVVCDESKTLGFNYCKGSPDFVIEVASPGTRTIDIAEKRFNYEKAGVKEYWIVDKDRVYQYNLVNGVYKETIYKITTGLKIKTEAIKGCVINFSGIFERYSSGKV